MAEVHAEQRKISYEFYNAFFYIFILEKMKRLENRKTTTSERQKLHQKINSEIDYSVWILSYF